MRNALVLVVALVAVSFATPAFAEDGSVPQATLNSLGLAGMDVMSDAEGLEVRGMASSFVQVHGASLIVGQLATADFKNFVVGSSGNQVEGNGETTSTGLLTISKDHNVNLSLTLDVVFPDLTVFSGSITGSAGGGGGVQVLQP